MKRRIVEDWGDELRSDTLQQETGIQLGHLAGEATIFTGEGVYTGQESSRLRVRSWCTDSAEKQDRIRKRYLDGNGRA